MQYHELRQFRDLCGRPERICWVVAEYQGKRSICPLGWKMWTSSEPPMMAISVAPARFSHELILRSREFVLAWPGAELAEATLLAGTRSGRNIDKFAEAGLTALPARLVTAPLVGECLANLECQLVSQLSTGDHTIFVGQIVAVHLTHPEGKPLLSIGQGEGYEFLLAKGGYRFGVIK